MNELEKIRNSGNMYQLDGFLAGLIIQYNLSDHGCRQLFGIGYSKWKKLKSGKYLEHKEWNYVRQNAVSLEMILELMKFYRDLDSEPGFGGCRHRRLKRYINLDGITNYTHLFDYYTDNHKSKLKLNCYNIFYKYSVAYCSDYTFTKLKEDCCD